MAKQDQAPSREEAAAAFVSVVLDDAYLIRFALYNEDPEAGEIGLFPRRRANRDQLRGFAAQGYLTPEQIAEVNELYPPRSAKDEAEEEETGAPTSEATPEPVKA